MDIDRWRSRLPVRRGDGEIVGWTVGYEPLGYDTVVDVVNPVGHVLARDVDVVDASAVALTRGLASLTENYWALAPSNLLSGTDLRRPGPEWTWRRMTMTQLDDTKVWVRPAYPGYAERLVEVAVPLPADDVLVPHPAEPAE